MGTGAGAVPYLADLLSVTPRDTNGGFRPAPRITPPTATAELPLQRTCLNRGYFVAHNATLSFCTGSTVGGVVKPFIITNPRAVRTDTLIVSIANNAVFQRALFSGTRSSYPRVVRFPDLVLRSL